MAYVVCHPQTQQPFVTPSGSVLVTHERIDALHLEVVRMPQPVPITFRSATALVPYWVLKRANIEWTGSISGWTHSLRVTAAPVSFEAAKAIYELMLSFNGGAGSRLTPEDSRTARLDERMHEAMRVAMRQNRHIPPGTIVVGPLESTAVTVADPRQRRVVRRK